ncbi:MAG: DUF3410 domain-containing protein [Chitinivibrionales bacterium]|nr:DUF3410 domain-containing protein [Chitinivibrionales bacterium]
MIVLADTNIRMAESAFSQFGTVNCMPGREITKEHLNNVGMLIVRSVTRVGEELLRETPVKFVGTTTIGIDHIDTGYLRDDNIGFASAPGSNADSVAEYVVSALFHLNKGSDFKGKTIGIIGVGNVGSRVCARARTLGFQCLLNDPPKKKRTGCDIFRELPEVLGQADIVTVHVPLENEGEYATRHMINDSFLSMMKEGAILVNTSRGNVSDEDAIVKNRSKLGGCVLDVWQNEPDLSEKTLSVADIATPHIAGYSIDGKIRGTKMVYDAACAFLFKENKWDAGDYRKEGTQYSIDLKESSDPVFDAMRFVYPIMEDDAALREITSKKAEERASYFDSLRANYGDRYECLKYSVVCSKGQEREAGILKGLGFSVVID